MTPTDVLTAIDEALDAGMPTETDPVTRELQELGLLLRADAPEPTGAYRERLGRRVERGFPKRESSRSPWWRHAIQPVAALALVALAVGLIALAGSGLSGSSGDNSGGSSGGGIAEDAGGGGGGVGEGATESGSSGAATSGAEPALSDPAASLPSGRGFAPGRSERRIERSFALELEAPADRMQRIADQVTAVTNRHGGFVLSSSVSTGEDSSGGDFDLRIPATEVRPALRDLAALGEVRSQTQTGRDVTPEYVTARDRLRSARAERKSLLRRLEAATTDTDAEAIRRRLDIVAGEINGLRGRLHGLRLRTDYAVVAVSLAAKDSGDGGSGAGSFGDAVDDAGDIAVGIAGVLVRLLAVILPLGLVALLAWLATRALQRRRRESALL